MALSIRNPRAEQLAREIAAMSGENITHVIIHALENHIERLRGQRIYPDTVKEIINISTRCSSIPDIDRRTPDEILGYNKIGVNE